MKLTKKDVEELSMDKELINQINELLPNHKKIGELNVKELMKLAKYDMLETTENGLMMYDDYIGGHIEKIFKSGETRLLAREIMKK